jgi:hypothetical protein
MLLQSEHPFVVCCTLHFFVNSNTNFSVNFFLFLLLWQMSRFGTRARRWWDEEDESDVDDLFIIAGLRDDLVEHLWAIHSSR